MTQSYKINIRAINLFTAFIIAIIGSSCGNDVDYEGRVIQIDYRNIDDINDNAWVEVDGIKYTHYEDFQKAYQDEFSVPASKETYIIVNSESERVKRYSPVSDFTIAISLGNFIDFVHSKRDTTLARVKINQRYLMHTFGRLIIQRPDSTIFKIKTSNNYPADITVVAK